MSDETRVTELFERALATVPPPLLTPPRAAIRRRVRRRRATGWAAAAVVAGVVLAGAAVARPDPAPVPPRPAASTPRPAGPVVTGVPWHTARVDRTGTRVTVYAAPLPGKCVAREPAGDRVDWGEHGIAVFLAGAYTGCRDDEVAAAHTFVLPQAVGDRTVLDARDPGGRRVVVRDTQLPDLAAGGWTELPAVWAGGAILVLRFTRPGGPDLGVSAFRWDPDGGARLTAADHTVTVGGRTVDVYGAPGGPRAGWWSADGTVRFTMAPVDAGVGNSAFDEIIRGMTWS
ncbi:hypothetical protein Daura_38835 [Dactylosporangium aurantiacum]|uniref:Uncharacterized protein n=1 Tax=Dactylosporangium aurantiacum TaxID=35754 RepID=A0A9Q9MB58_9ACTN|nr:hypothetical protein [Dactylosporangium aurantiacum]MDG6101621.1 hypothetical protein [Dactylosporangium aurantiacum]UWZ52553.1 hypothetical protein Daura_38835 [Dactylosporangium aurantiacum]